MSLGPIVAVDVDEVLCRYSEGFVQWQLNGGGGETKSLPEVGACFKIACKKDNGQAREDFAKSQAFIEIPVVPGALEALQRLQELGVRIEAVTSRPSSMQEATDKWLASFFPGLLAQAHYAQSGQKGVICRSIGATLIVDDQARNVSDVCKEGLSAVLFDFGGTYAWNQAAKLPEKAVRLRNWEEVLEHLCEALELEFLSAEVREEPKPGQSHDAVEAQRISAGPAASAACLDLEAAASAACLDLATSTVSPAVDLLDDFREASPEPSPVEPEQRSAHRPPGEAQVAAPACRLVGDTFLAMPRPARIPEPPGMDAAPLLLEVEVHRAEDLGAQEDTQRLVYEGGRDSDFVGLASLDCNMAESTVLEPLISGYLLKKKEDKALWLARSLVRTPARGACWQRLYFVVGPEPSLRYWSTAEKHQQGEAPQGTFDLLTADVAVRGMELLLDGGRLFLRSPSSIEARRWQEACRAVALIKGSTSGVSAEELIRLALGGTCV